MGDERRHERRRRADTIVNGTSNFSAGRGAADKTYSRCHGAFDPAEPTKVHCIHLCDLCAES